MCPVCTTGEEEGGRDRLFTESSAQWRSLRTQCPPPSEFTAGSGNSPPSLPPAVVIISVCSLWCVLVGCVGVISPRVSPWVLQVLEIANSRTITPALPAPPQLSVETMPPDGKLLTATTWRPHAGYSLFLLRQAPVELPRLISPSPPWVCWGGQNSCVLPTPRVVMYCCPS